MTKLTVKAHDNVPFIPIIERMYEDCRKVIKFRGNTRPETVKAVISYHIGETNSWREAARVYGAIEDSIYKFQKGAKGKELKEFCEDNVMKHAAKRAGYVIMKTMENEKDPRLAMQAAVRVRDEVGFKPTEKRQIETTGTPQVGMMQIIHPDALPEGGIEAIFPQLSENKGEIIDGEASEV